MAFQYDQDFNKRDWSQPGCRSEGEIHRWAIYDSGTSLKSSLLTRRPYAGRFTRKEPNPVEFEAWRRLHMKRLCSDVVVCLKETFLLAGTHNTLTGWVSQISAEETDKTQFHSTPTGMYGPQKCLTLGRVTSSKRRLSSTLHFYLALYDT